ncbi:reverse transcriptase domain-containing protein [Tanacetum coccineum]
MTDRFYLFSDSTPLGDSDFSQGKVDRFSRSCKMISTYQKVDDSYYDPEGDILLLKAFRNDDPSLPPPTQGNYLPEIRKELKVCDNSGPVLIDKDSVSRKQSRLLKVLKSHKRSHRLEYYSTSREGIVLGHKISKNGIEVDKAKVDVIAKLPHPTTVKGVRSFLQICQFLTESSRGNTYILAAVDYLSKWVEAKALPTNDARAVCKFLKSIFARFGAPRAIIRLSRIFEASRARGFVLRSQEL